MKRRLIVMSLGVLVAAGLVWGGIQSGVVGAQGMIPNAPDVRGRPVLAEAAAEQLAARLDYRGLGRLG